METIENSTGTETVDTGTTPEINTNTETVETQPTDQYSKIMESIKSDVNYQLTPEDHKFLKDYKAEKPSTDPLETEVDPNAPVDETVVDSATLTPEQEELFEIMDTLGVDDIKDLNSKFKETLISKDTQIQQTKQEYTQKFESQEATGKMMHDLMTRMRRGDPNAIAEFDKITGYDASKPDFNETPLPFKREDLVEPEVFDYFQKSREADRKMISDLAAKVDSLTQNHTENVNNTQASENATNELCNIAEKYLNMKGSDVRQMLQVYRASNGTITPKGLAPIKELVDYADANHVSLEHAYMLKDYQNMGKKSQEAVQKELKSKLTGPQMKNTLAGTQSTTKAGSSDTRLDAINAKIRNDKNYVLNDDELDYFTKHG